MSDFLSNLVQRSLAATGVVRPRLLSIFEPPAANDAAFSREGETPGLSAMEQPHRDFSAAPSPSQASERKNAGEPHSPVVAASSDPPFAAVSESPGSPGTRERAWPRAEFPEELPARTISAPDTNEAIPSRLEQPTVSQPVPPHPDLPKKRPQTAELVTTDEGAGALEIEAPRASKQVRPRADPPGSQQAKTSPRRENAEAPGRNEEIGGRPDLLRPFPVRPRVDFLGKPGATHASARSRNADEKGAAATGSRFPSEQAHSLSTAGAREAPVPHDPAKNQSELRADKMIEIMNRERDADGPLPGPRDVRAVSPRPLSPRALAFAQQPKDPPVAPSINVTIGRIEVRATLPAAAPSKISRGVAPLMNLDEYLRQRAGGNRR